MNHWLQEQSGLKPWKLSCKTVSCVLCVMDVLELLRFIVHETVLQGP